MALFALEMLPTGPLVSGVLDFVSSLAGFFELLTRFNALPDSCRW
jgi:hypothetical protein